MQAVRDAMEESRPPDTAGAQPKAIAERPAQAVRKIQSLNERQKNELASILSQKASNPHAYGRTIERQVNGHTNEMFSEVPLNKAIDDVFSGAKVTVKAENSKGVIVNAEQTIKMVFDPSERYFTIQVKNQEGQWIYKQAIWENGSLRWALPSEKVRTGNPEWLQMTHFSY